MNILLSNGTLSQYKGMLFPICSKLELNNTSFDGDGRFLFTPYFNGRLQCIHMVWWIVQDEIIHCSGMSFYEREIVESTILSIIQINFELREATP